MRPRIGPVILAITFAALTAVGAGRAPSSATPRREAEIVSLIAVIAAPERYDGHLVRVVGVVQVEFEQDLLYVSRQDFEHRVLTNAIGLLFEDRATPEQRSWSGLYVGVEGVFRRKQPGTRGIQVGTLRSIRRIEKWEPPTPPR